MDRAVVARELFFAWAERHWWWLAPMLLLALYLLIAFFDQLDQERGRYAEIERTQQRIDAELARGSWCDPAYFVVEARSPQEAANKLLNLTIHVDSERMSLMHLRDVTNNGRNP